MKALREEQLAQASSWLERMSIAKVFFNIVLDGPEAFRKFWSSALDCPRLAEIIKSVEDRGSLPYYVTHELTSFGECYSILTVSPYKEDFAISTPAYDVKSGTFRVYAYVWNASDEYKSEPGSILVRCEHGILFRVV